MSGTYLAEDIEQSQRIFADMKRSEYSCLEHFLGSLGPGVPALGGLEHETFFKFHHVMLGMNLILQFFRIEIHIRPNSKTDIAEQ